MQLYTHSDKNLNTMADGSTVCMYSGLIDFLVKEKYIQTVLARSGYEIKNVHKIWRRMSLLSSNMSSPGSTIAHPAPSKRFFL